MSSSINLAAMKIFLAVYDLRSVNLAAKALAMSQSGLSTALSKLRSDLDDPLFIGTASGMQPTARAKELVGPMREAATLVELKILKRNNFDAATSTQEFRIALSDVAEAIYMPKALNALSLSAPGVRIRTIELPQPQLQRALSEGQVDLALGYLPDLESKDFLRRKIAQHGFVCICASTNKRVIDGFNLKKYSEARHAIVEAPGRTQGLLERFVQQRGIRRIVALTTPHVMSLPETISGTDMIASIPDALAAYFSEFKRVTRLALPFRSPVFDSHLYWGKSMHIDPANRWLRSVLTGALDKAFQ